MISINDLTFAYPAESPIFSDFNFHIARGDLYGLLGPNGAGKTTLITLITGLNKPQYGQILFEDQQFPGNRKDILQKLAVVPQEYAFYSQLTAYENLQFFSKLYPERQISKSQIEKAIELTGLESHVHRIAKQFSGGLKRRLNLAIGLLNEPEFLILDEPTVGIDPQSRRFILQAIQALNQQGTTILYTSHYMEEVEQICRHVAIIDQGKILVSGTLDELLSTESEISFQCRQPVTAEALGEDGIKFIREYSLSISDNIISGHLPDEAQVAQLINYCANQNIQIDNIQYGRQTLESLFFELTHTRLRES